MDHTKYKEDDKIDHFRHKVLCMYVHMYIL